VAVTDRRPGQGRYAHVEREQRWIAAGLPAEARRTAEILDRYICGTRLRLRRMEMSGEVVFKLGQKVRLDPTNPEVVMLTTMYISGDECDVMAALPAGELRKTRWNTAWDGRTVAIDEFHGRLSGLFLAEVELGPDDLRLPTPAFALRDVTDDDRFSGGTLAFASDRAVKLLLHEAGSPSEC
jgi:CYTH domain-containing protein